MPNPTKTPVAASGVTAAKPVTSTPAAAPVESKRQKFVRLGGIRVAKALSSVRVIGNLASPNYEFTQADIDKIGAALQAAVKETMGKFAAKLAGTTGKKEASKFEL